MWQKLLVTKANYWLFKSFNFNISYSTARDVCILPTRFCFGLKWKLWGFKHFLLWLFNISPTLVKNKILHAPPRTRYYNQTRTTEYDLKLHEQSSINFSPKRICFVFFWLHYDTIFFLIEKYLYLLKVILVKFIVN